MFYVFPQAISKKECEKLLDYCIKNTELKEAAILNPGESDADANRSSRVYPKIRITDIAFVEPDANGDNKVNELAWQYLIEANARNFNYKIETFQLVQFARYRDGGHYAWHRDVNESALVPNGTSRKLSLTLCLSDPKDYEGGDLEFFHGERPLDDIVQWDGKIVKGEQVHKHIQDQGSVIVFDSRDWHRVTPVTKGTRYSLVCWSVGPNLV